MKEWFDEEMPGQDDGYERMFYPERFEGYVAPNKQVVEVPKLKSKWLHTNGVQYKVIHIANLENTIKYPLTVVYKGKNGKVWTRVLSDWYRSFSPKK